MSNNANTFIAVEKHLVHYVGKPVVDQEFSFYSVDDDGNQTEFDFTGYTGLRFRIYDKRGRNQKLIYEWTDLIYTDGHLSLSGNVITWNAQEPEMSIFAFGKYYHELYFLDQNDNKIVLIYGDSKFI